MNGRFDARVWLPLLTATAVLAMREYLARDVATPDPVASDALELPAPPGLPPTRHDACYELDAGRSSVRFHVTGPQGEMLLSCPAARGRLELRADAAGQLDLELDLGSLVRTAADAGPGLDLHHLLGVHRSGTITYRATLQSRATSQLPGTSHLQWLGTLSFGDHLVRQPIDLWQTAVAGQPLRLQGRGTVGTETYGLSRRSWFGLVQEHHVVTLGLDLAWKRSPAH